MQITLKALFDEETRKQIKEFVLDQARSVARSEIDKAVKSEIARVLKAKIFEIMGLRWQDDIFRTAVKDVIDSRWVGIAEEIQKSAEHKVEQAVQVKLANKTVWEAEKQEGYVRRVVREELRRILAES